MNLHVEGLRTPVARARGFGSAKYGVCHWWVQRLTAVGLVPLTFWFIFSIVSLSNADYDHVRHWIKMPSTAVLLVILVMTVFYHAQLGMQVVYEDYVRPKWVMVIVDIITKFACFLFVTISVFSVLKIAFGG
jgi:succinate dehydrogenase / fumarate reductase membrane anchor subunit